MEEFGTVFVLMPKTSLQVSCRWVTGHSGWGCGVDHPPPLVPATGFLLCPLVQELWLLKWWPILG